MVSKKKSREQCVICLDDLVHQEIGIPDNCQHIFCFPCLVNWTKDHDTCPNDRQKFQFIFKKHSFFNEGPYAKVDIKDPQKEIFLGSDPILCQACGNDNEEYHPMLTCSQCNDSFHDFCLNTSDLSKWICPSCEYENIEKPEFAYRLLTTKRPKQGTFSSKDPSNTSQIAHHPTISTTNVKTEQHTKKRLIISPSEAVRRVAASSLPISPSFRSTILIHQAQNMAKLRHKRKQFARLPSKIPVDRLPRIQRRNDAPIRPQSKSIQKKSTRSASSTTFIDRLLQFQQKLHSLENIQMHGAQINVS